MNGWTPSISLEQRVNNLMAQIPAEHRAIASLKCYGKDDHDFERKLTAFVVCKGWEHPADVAYALEALPEAEQVAAEVANDDRWLDSDPVAESWDFTPFPANMPDIDFDKTDEIPF